MFGFLFVDTVNYLLVNQLIVVLINVISALLIVTIVIRNTFRDKLTSVFFVMGLLIFAWIDFAFLARLAGSNNIFWAELFLRMAWVATPPLFVYVYLITIHMLHKEKQLAMLNKILVGSAIVNSALTAFTDYYIKGVTFSGNNLDIEYGKGFYLFLGFITLYVLVTLISIFTTKLKDHRRRRVRIFLIGIILFYVANVIFNITLPVFFGITHLYYLGDYSLVFLLGFTAYAILRYHLLDIRAIIFRAVGFAVLTSLFFVIYAVLAYFVIIYLKEFHLSGLQVTLLSAVALTFAVPLHRYFSYGLRRITNRFLFQQQADYRKGLITVSKELSGTINISDVTSTVLRAMEDIVHSKKTIILLQKTNSTSFTPQAMVGVKNLNISIPQDHILIKHISHSRGALVKDELVIEKEQEQSPQRIARIEEVENTFNWLDIAIILPLYVNKKLTGFIALGDKLSGVPYVQDDINFLSALAPQAAIALENARLYKESLEFGEKLEMEIKQATAELSVANEQLRDLDKAKSEFLSIASHQLYTPLTALRGYLSMIREGDYGVVNKKQKPIIDILEKSANRLIGLIKNLLDISRIESGRLELDLESTNLVEIVDSLVTELKPNAITKQLDFKFVKNKKPLPRVVVDRMRIRQVLLNFMDNAIKYTDKGSVEVAVDREGEELVFAVTDSGQGLTREGIAKLFNKFMRVGGEARFRTEGTGLGLYLAKQIVKEHHGEVEVTSPGLGEGSTFSMRVPIEDSPNSLKAGERVSVKIKAAEAEGGDGSNENI